MRNPSRTLFVIDSRQAKVILRAVREVYYTTDSVR